ncbi:MAG: hypothetical protein ACPG61_18260 [Paracoccaceae bacterium]
MSNEQHSGCPNTWDAPMTDKQSISPDAVERLARQFDPLHPQVGTFTVFTYTGVNVAATLRAQAARITELEAQLATASSDACNECGGLVYIGDTCCPICSPEAQIEARAMQPTPAVGAQDSDTELLNAIANNYWDLKCIDVPTGMGDADIDWIVVEHHMGEKGDVIVAQAYEDDPRQAIRLALIERTDP